MNKEDLRIVFMGTPEFAVEGLKALVIGGYKVVGVVTMPDKPAGRGHKVKFSAVKEYALEQKLELLQPTNLKDKQFLSELAALNADLQIVVAFRMLPEVVWGMPKQGTFNLHASLLPQYRGAAPINWAIINGETETGVTSFFLKHEIDTGKIIKQEKIAILPVDDAGSLHDKLMVLGAKVVTETVDMIIDGTVDAVPQHVLYDDKTTLKSAPKLFKESCELDIKKLTEDAHNLVRGLSPYPVAWFNVRIPGQEDELALKIYESEIEKIAHSHALGEIIIVDKSELKIALKDGYLKLMTIQAPGKRRMSIKDFLNGLR